MKRPKKILNPKMLSARVEKSDFNKLEEILCKQNAVSFQDLLNFSVRQFISGSITIEGNQVKFNALLWESVAE